MARKTTTDSSELLEIHVLGAGKGESIVLRCPGGEWGVVDCYAPSLEDCSTNPTLQFLKQQGVSELEFLCLTHPHDDHFRGMSQLLEHLTVKHFWRFAGLAGRDLKRLAQVFHVDAERSGVSELAGNASDFVKTMSLIQQKRSASQLRQKTVSGYQQLFPIPAGNSEPFQIWSFAPSGNQLASYEEALASCFTADGRFRSPLPQAHHNSVSVGLLIRFGDTRIVLGGDIDPSGWRDALDEIQEDQFFVDAVKVSHHGSVTGYAPGLWEVFSAKRKPIAVIVPYRRFRLPKAEAIKHIRPHVSKIMVTCQFDSDIDLSPAKSPLKSRLYLRTQLKAKPALPESECGRCTLVYDSSSTCVSSECNSPAFELES
jgi:beta-lactamase superfamily II metal-dependent hydrolase